MSYSNRKAHPLQKLGNYEDRDCYAFAKYLRLPVEYLAEGFRLYKNIQDIVRNCTKIISAVNAQAQELTMYTLQEKRYLTKGIPPQYLKPKTVIANSATAQSDFNWLLETLAEWTPKGKNFYFHSEFNMEGAVDAGVAVVKKATDLKVNAFLVSWPNIMEALYEFDSDNPTIERIKNTDLLVLWAVGCEHTTDFVLGKLKELLALRSINGRSTVICSGLTPAEYAVRYKGEPEGIKLAFKGKNQTDTIAALKKELARG